MGRLCDADKTLLHQRIEEALRAYPDGIPAGHVQELRRAFDISPSTFYDHQARVTDRLGQRTAKQEVATRTGRWVPTKEMHPYLAITYSGTLTKAHRVLEQKFPGQVPGYEDFTKAVKYRMDQDDRAQLRGGRGKDTDTHRYEPRQLSEAPHPGFRWCIDVKDLHVEATPDNIYRPAKARSVNLVDDTSGKVLVSIPVLGTVGPEHILAVLIQAVWLYGGIAHELHSDNGGEFLNDDVVLFLMRFGSRLSTSKSFRSVQNGRVESYQSLIAQRTDTLMGGRRDPELRNGKKMLTFKGVATVSSIVDELEATAAEVNDSVLARHGMTRNERWNSPDLNLLAIDNLDAVVAEYALPDSYTKNRGLKIADNRGVMLFEKRYTHPALFTKAGLMFRIKYLPTVRTHVFVYGADGQFLCVAILHKGLSAKQRKAVGARHATSDSYTAEVLATGAQLAADDKFAAGHAPPVLPPPGWTAPDKNAPEPRGTFPTDLPDRSERTDLSAHDATPPPTVAHENDDVDPADATTSTSARRPGARATSRPAAASGPAGLVVSTAHDLLDGLLNGPPSTATTDDDTPSAS